jgi:hypothetical protein
MLAIATDGAHLMCSGFNLGKTIRFGGLELLVDCFGSLSLSPKGSDSCAIFVGTTRTGSPPLGPMIEDFNRLFNMASRREGIFDLFISQWQSTGALPAPIGTTPWLEDTSTTQAMITV